VEEQRKPDEWQELVKTKYRTAGVFVSKDVFDAVVVAAFGELRIDMPASNDFCVHPVWMMLAALPVFVAQFSTILYFSLDQDLTAPVRENETYSDVLYMSKLVTVVILQVTVFSPLLSSFKLLCFVCNPMSWLECRWPGSSRSEITYPWVWRCGILLAFVAVFMKLFVTYQVLVASVSVILACRSVTEALFNGLAMTFVVDLAKIVCKVITSLCSLEDFVADDEGESPIVVDQIAQAELALEGDGCKWYLWFMNALRMNDIYKEKQKEEEPIFGANILTTFVTAVFMFFIYQRQIEIVAYANFSNVLPISRDVCTYARWFTGEHGSNATWVAAKVFTNMCRFLTVLNVEKDIIRQTDPSQGGYCTAKYDRMRDSDREALNEEHTHLYWVECLLLVVLVLPHVVHWGLRKWRSGASLRSLCCGPVAASEVDTGKPVFLREKEILDSIKWELDRQDDLLDDVRKIAANNSAS